MSIALAYENDFLGDIGRLNGHLGDHQQQHLGAIQRIDDLFTPLRRAVNASLIDPQGNTGRAKLCSQFQNALLVLSTITYEYVCLRSHWIPDSFWVTTPRVGTFYCDRLAQTRLATRQCRRPATGNLPKEASTRQGLR